MRTFRHFMIEHRATFNLREEEAAPPGGVDTGDQGTSTTNKHHFSSLEREFDIDDIGPALEGDSVTLFQIPDYGWGFRVLPPIQTMVKEIGGNNDTGDAQYEVTFMLTTLNRKKFVLPYKDGETPQYYEGPIEDQTVMMTQEELSNAMAKPIEDSGGMGAPMGGGMGDPMGGGMGAPMGGPPMGGGMGGM